MARTSVATQNITTDGLALATSEPTVDGDVIRAGNLALYLENTSASAVTVTVQTPATVDGLDVDELVVSVAAGETKLVGPLPRATFGRPSEASVDPGRVYVDYSPAPPTGLNRAVIAF